MTPQSCFLIFPVRLHLWPGWPECQAGGGGWNAHIPVMPLLVPSEPTVSLVVVWPLQYCHPGKPAAHEEQHWQGLCFEF